MGNGFAFDLRLGQWAWMVGPALLSFGAGKDWWHQGWNLPNVTCVGCSVAGNDTGPGPRLDALTYWSKGALYVYGGYSRMKGPVTFESYGDMWRYTPRNDTWQYLGGPINCAQSQANSSYGQLGVESSTNMPWGRVAPGGGVSSDGTLWVYAGRLHPLCPGDICMGNDLWSFNINNWMWTWRGGSQ